MECFWGKATDNQIEREYLYNMYVCFFLKIYVGSLYIYSFGIVGRWFSESDPLGLLSAGVTTSFVDGFSMTMMAPCQTYAFASGTDNKHSLFHNSLGWCVTSETDDTIWIRLNFFQLHSYIYIYIYLCTFPTWSTQDLDNFPTQISGELEWPLIFTGSDVCSWKGQKTT